MALPRRQQRCDVKYRTAFKLCKECDGWRDSLAQPDHFFSFCHWVAKKKGLVNAVQHIFRDFTVWLLKGLLSAHDWFCKPAKVILCTCTILHIHTKRFRSCMIKSPNVFRSYTAPFSSQPSDRKREGGLDYWSGVIW